MKGHVAFGLLLAMSFGTVAVPASAAVLYPESDALVRVLDARRRQPQRTTALIVTEIQQLETLFRTTPPASADRPALIRRLADDFAALERAFTSEGKATEAASARGSAIRNYAMLVGEYPGYASIGEVRTFLGLEYAASNDTEHARGAFVAAVPDGDAAVSGEASFLVGETWLEPKDAPHAKTAKGAYDAALAKLPASHALRPWVLLRVGMAQEIMGEKGAAQQTWHELRTQYPTSEAVSEIPRPPVAIQVPAGLPRATVK